MKGKIVNQKILQAEIIELEYQATLKHQLKIAMN